MKFIIKLNVLALIAFLCFGSISAQTNLAEEAKSALNSGNNQRAIELYNQLIQSADKYAPSYYARGMAKFNLKNIDAAIEDFTKAGELDDKYYQAFYGLALCYLEKADYRKVMDFVQKVKSINERFAPNYYVKGLALYYTKNFPQANIAFVTALTLDDKYYKANYARAICLKEMNLLELSIKEFQYYIKMAGNQDGLQAECERLIADIQKELKNQ